MRFIFSMIWENIWETNYSVLFFFLLIRLWVSLNTVKLCEILFSSSLDLPEVSWWVHWIVKAKLDGINPPHEWSFTFGFSPWSKESDGKDQWVGEDVDKILNDEDWGIKEDFPPSEEELPSVSDVVNPEHGEDWVVLFSLPVVIWGGLGKTVVKSSGVNIFPISVVHSWSNDSNN